MVCTSRLPLLCCFCLAGPASLARATALEVLPLFTGLGCGAHCFVLFSSLSLVFFVSVQLRRSHLSFLGSSLFLWNVRRLLKMILSTDLLFFVETGLFYACPSKCSCTGHVMGECLSCLCARGSSDAIDATPPATPPSEVRLGSKNATPTSLKETISRMSYRRNRFRKDPSLSETICLYSSINTHM